MGKLVVVTVNAGMLDLSWLQASPGVGAIVVAMYLGMASGHVPLVTMLPPLYTAQWGEYVDVVWLAGTSPFATLLPPLYTA